MPEPLVSVLIPVYNAGYYLRPAVDSILRQTYKNLEVLIIDDGSTDGCLDYISDIKDSRITIHTQPNSGRAVALNRGIERSSGVFYTTHDADDISYPDRVAYLVQYLISKSDVAGVFSGHDIILNGRKIAPCFRAKNPEQCRRDIERFSMPAHDPTGIYRMAMVTDFKYEHTLRIGAGYDYILRLGEALPIGVVGRCLYSYRVHLESNTRKNAELRCAMIEKVLKRAYARRGLDLPQNIKKSISFSGCGHKNAEYGLVSHFMESVLDLRNAWQYVKAVKTAFTCISMHPCDPYYYKPLVYCLVPLNIIRWYRQRKYKRA